MSVGFGFGGGWGVGFGWGGGGWGVSVGFSSGWGGCGWGGYGWNSCWSPCYTSCWSPWWSGCSTWYAPWYSGGVYIASPIYVETPVYYYPVATTPLVVEEPVVATPALDWPGYAPMEGTVPVEVAAAPASTIPVQVPLQTGMPVADPIEQGAWDLLALGEDARAEEQFAMVLNHDAANARARSGYGLTAALNGRESTAAWALRDALALRPDALDALPLTGGVRSQLTELARTIEARAQSEAVNAKAVDDLFVAAALRAAVGDRAQAAYAMELAARRGILDDTRSQFRARLASQIAMTP